MGRYNCNQAAIISQPDKQMLLFASERNEADKLRYTFNSKTSAVRKFNPLYFDSIFVDDG